MTSMLLDARMFFLYSHGAFAVVDRAGRRSGFLDFGTVCAVVFCGFAYQRCGNC